MSDALDAIIRCDATEEAYEVAEAFGFRELFPGVIYKIDSTEGEKKGQMSLDATTARTIIKQAIKDETYGGAEPEDDATCIKEAGELVDMAEQAWAQYIRGPEVETILKLAAGASENGGDPEQSSKLQSPPESSTPSSSTGGESSNADGDDEKSGPPQSLEGIDPELTKVMPWAGYSEDRVADITAGINVAIEEYDSDDSRQLLQHIWAYEASHKNRSRILKHVQETWARISGDNDGARETAGEKAPSQAGDELASSSTEVSSATESPQSGTDAGTESVSEVGQSSVQGGVPQSAPKATAKNQPTVEFGQADENEAYQALIQGVERELQNERAHVPLPPTEEPPKLPWKWADVSDADLHDFHMQFASLAYWTAYRQTREERVAMHCKEAADELRRELLKRHPASGKDVKVTVIEAQIESDPNVKQWRRRQHKHELFALAAKRELESYHKMVESLSRLESMRHQSWERARR